DGPKIAESGGQLRARWPVLRRSYSRGELLKRRQHARLQTRQPCCEFRIVADRHRLLPDCPPPAACQRFIFQLVDFTLDGGRKAGLECRKPILVQPSERHGPQRISRQLRQRVVRNRLAPVHEKGNLVSRENSLYGVVVSGKTS